MEVLAVFRCGKWIEYIPGITLRTDPRITRHLCQKAASVYTSALQKGFQEERAHTLAEAVIFKEIYEDLLYESGIESDIRKVMYHEGKA